MLLVLNSVTCLLKVDNEGLVNGVPSKTKITPNYTGKTIGLNWYLLDGWFGTCK